jgi:zinc transporter ZupT
MGAIQGYFATSGIGSLLGAALGWFIFKQSATGAPNCVLPGSDTCLEMWGMPFLPFVLAFAAFGGVIGLVVQVVRNDVL